MHLDPPVVKKTSEEIRNWKTKATKNMRKKNNRLVSSLTRKRLPHGNNQDGYDVRSKGGSLIENKCLCCSQTLF